MDVLLVSFFTLGGLAAICATLYSYKRYKDLVTLNRRTNYYPLNLKESNTYSLFKIDFKEYHIRSTSDGAIVLKFKLLINLSTYRKFQVTNSTDEEVALLKKTKHWFFGRDYIQITSRNRYEVRAPTVVAPQSLDAISPASPTSLDICLTAFHTTNPLNSGLTDEYSNIDSPTPLVSLYIDPTIYSNYEVPLKQIGPSKKFSLNQDLKRVERRKLFKIKTILNKNAKKSISFQINKNSLEYKWINGSLMKISKNFKQTPVMETLGIIEDSKLKNREGEDMVPHVNIHLNTVQVEEIVGLLSLFLYLYQINGV
ncbi:hypothetical protein WICPIJ_009670 [Wickerhamomyces pijperi]|uniref:Uncharacterized protein n=1 Tax=Wickerhamomyces pijperi TaxID=599730 RepID=A0A9P8TCJ7_WICPI|nr:hypothetical protein WICPIJ_009670 [Wickerhamomyces pijperi]